MEFAAVIIVFFLLGGIVCGYLAISRISTLSRELQQLKGEVRELAKPGVAQDSGDTEPTSVSKVALSAAVAPRADRPPDVEQLSRPSRPAPEPSAPTDPSTIDRFFDGIRANWMIWLGGACVALAGVFLVRYSIERGLLGPGARIALALVFGVSFHAVAEWLRRRSGSAHAALGALAGAGSLTLYAALLAALRLYGFISPGVAFAAMAVVALGTMLMARVHGPLLAAFGILGAFLVPVLVSSGSGDVRIVLVYALIVSASALFLMRYVYRAWLWWGFALGALLWGFLALDTAVGPPALTLYFGALGYLVAAVPHFDWSLRRQTEVPGLSYRPAALWSVAHAQDRHQLVFYVLLVLGVFLSIIQGGSFTTPWPWGLVFLLLALLLSRRQDQLYWLPWVSLLSIALAWLILGYAGLPVSAERAPFDPMQFGGFKAYLLATAFLCAGLSLWNLGVSRRAAVFASMATLAPVLLLTVAYLLFKRPDANWNWGLSTVMIALAYLAVATLSLRKLSIESLVVWLFIAGHFALALAAAMAFREASLTLALAAQLLSLAWVVQKFELPELGWLLKLVIAVVIARLTLNPWLAAYPVDVHWSLWTYGGSTVFAAAGAYFLRANYRSLSDWLGGAALHLFALTLWSELRYQLYDGAVYAARYSFTEAVISMLLFAVLALIYHYRAQFSETLARFMRLYAKALLIAASGSYLVIVVRTLSSDAWVYQSIGTTPIMNMGTAAYGGPVVLACLFAAFYDRAYRRRALIVAGIAGMLFVSLQIRHLWTGALRLNAPPYSDGELYTYSAVWLLIAIAGVLGGACRFGQDVYRAGMVLLALVIAKLFFVDMAGLEGLLRVASFMGLGLSLLALSFLHQRLAVSRQEN